MSRQSWLVVSILIALTVVTDRAYVFYASSYSIDKNTHNSNKTEQDQEDFKSPVLSVLSDVEDFIDAHEKLFIVLFTGAIAWFTGTLWRATNALVASAKKQADDMRESLRIAKQSAEAARDSADGIVNANIPYVAPELRMADSNLRLMNALGEQRVRPTVNFVFKNYGGSPATIVEFSDYLAFFDVLPQEPIYPPRPADATDREMVIGALDASRVLPCGLVVDTVHWAEARMTFAELRAERRAMFLIGRVVYDDVFGLRHTKRYCFRFDIRAMTILFRPYGGRPYNLRTKEKSPYA